MKKSILKRLFVVLFFSFVLTACGQGTPHDEYTVPAEADVAVQDTASDNEPAVAVDYFTDPVGWLFSQRYDVWC